MSTTTTFDLDRFARRFADGAALVRSGAVRFSEAVRSGEFPAQEEGF